MKWLFCFLLFFVAPGSRAQTNAPAVAVKLPSKKKLQIYLLMGQSNMAGRGQFSDEDKTPHPRVIVFTTNETWEPAIEPITKDRSFALGVGPGLAFGKVMAEKNSKITIGLVPCAVGGTPLSRWSKGGDLYERAVRRAKAAMRDGTLAGILWHQGENDSTAESTASTYGERLAKMIGDIRADLNSPKLSFVAGQIGEFLYARKDPTKTQFARVVNEVIAKIPEQVPHTACVKSTGLKHKGDEVHFDGESEREMGKRFATEIVKLQKGSE